MREKEKAKSAAIVNALFIGVMIGIVFYSVVKNSFGFLTLIPLYFAYKALTNSKEGKTQEKD